MKFMIMILSLLTFLSVSAQQKVGFELVVSYAGTVTRLEAGYSDSTTDNYDVDVEDDLPPFTPPEGILPAFRINRELSGGGSELIFSYKDYRAVPTIDSIDYTLDILGTREEGKEFYFLVPLSGPPKGIKEIRIIDRVSGTLVDSNIIDGFRLYVKNRFISDFIVRVKYELLETSVELADDGTIYYSDGTIYSTINNRNLEIYDANGRKYLDRVRVNNEYDINYLPNGIYFAYIYDKEFVVKMLKIVKL